MSRRKTIPFKAKLQDTNCGIPGHQGLDGNQLADREAKTGINDTQAPLGHLNITWYITNIEKQWSTEWGIEHI